MKIDRYNPEFAEEVDRIDREISYEYGYQNALFHSSRWLLGNSLLKTAVGFITGASIVELSRIVFRHFPFTLDNKSSEQPKP